MGEASGGGSGRPNEIVLAHSRLVVRLSTMASFRPDGSAYDGAGIEPDVVASPTLADHQEQGDSVMEKARALLVERAGS